ncbi:PIR Superfamily Protein [Plasmodium ovale wallikeri]|uniref:PIR Superfamily Protein n=1 Tax=Plasmodium ovale wallikeri TaxID=864142 RepID=A0A1A9AGZ7_PLAOA|nr:PIR Superfamily Protein [Plasmodium ovale wallikeri]
MPEVKENNIYKLLKEKHTFQKNSNIQNFYNELYTTCSGDTRHSCLRSPSQKYPGNTAFHNFIKSCSTNQIKFVSISDQFNNFKREPLKRCMYFKYWFYDQIITNGFDNEKIIEIFEVLSQFHNKIEFPIIDNHENIRTIASDVDSQIICQIHISNLSDIKKIKLSFDYLENYNSNDGTSGINKLICKRTQKNDMNEVINICINKVGDADEKSQLICEELDEYMKMHGIEQLSEVKCDAEDEELSSDDEFDSDLGVSPMDSLDSPTPSNDPNVMRSISVSLSLVAIFAIFLFLYKLTPLGTSLRRYIKKSSNILHNLRKKEQEELSQHSTNLDMVNFYNEPHNIAYHAS